MSWEDFLTLVGLFGVLAGLVSISIDWAVLKALLEEYPRAVGGLLVVIAGLLIIILSFIAPWYEFAKVEGR